MRAASELTHYNLVGTTSNAVHRKRCSQKAEAVTQRLAAQESTTGSRERAASALTHYKQQHNLFRIRMCICARVPMQVTRRS
jgi:hypothetical protein